ncbi:MAG: hypothetical protein LBH43_13130 [Treponema sp.]|nr:hypothetical protein [Treponema sp.]
MKPVIRRLYLAAPLIYIKADCKIGDIAAITQEIFYCFELEPSQAHEFEPDKDSFIKSLVYSGKAALPDTQESYGERAAIPAGNYLFSQEDGCLSERELIDIAVEVQKEGLWQRLEPGNCLYARYLSEDGRDVTQILRPYSFRASTI